MLRSTGLSASNASMLIELRVENYAVIDNIVVEFGRGLNLLSGETGAGKSILIDALALLLGDKASTETIRYGAEKAVINAVFEVNGGDAAKLLELNGIEPEGNEVIVRREISSRQEPPAGKEEPTARNMSPGSTGSGLTRSRVFINNQPATVTVLKELAPHLASLHAQRDTLAGFDASARRDLLDLFAGLDTARVEEAFAAWKTSRNRLAELESEEHNRLQNLDLWSFQKKEIESARLEIGEDQRLQTEKSVLANAEKIYSAVSAAYDLLYDSSSSAMVALRNALRHLELVSRYEPRFQQESEQLESARAAIEEVSSSLRDYAQGIDASPERLMAVEERLALLDRLKRKYAQGMNSSLAEIIACGEELSRKLDEIENREQILKEAKGRLSEAAAAYLKLARELSKKRYQAARKLETQVEAEINHLAMSSRFKIQITGSDAEAEWSANGFDRVDYLIATNAGEPLKPIEQIASGGELSRVMLALKATVASSRFQALSSQNTTQAGRQAGRQAGGKNDASSPKTSNLSNGKGSSPREVSRGEGAGNAAQPTLIFDEIDAGIGGSAAEAVGKKLKSLAREYQVLCVTHLPQIACFADHHYLVEKKELGGRTKTSIRQLADDERREELARMLSGEKLTETSRKHAEQMLKARLPK